MDTPEAAVPATAFGVALSVRLGVSLGVVMGGRGVDSAGGLGLAAGAADGARGVGDGVSKPFGGICAGCKGADSGDEAHAAQSYWTLQGGGRLTACFAIPSQIEA
mmetsp:Transcript_118735/g.368914  ORF Transcript_118735/g.368914 Transcript_118735/m.368914 type:complete len:105 (-) Transcript_118735:8-322(-)